MKEKSLIVIILLFLTYVNLVALSVLFSRGSQEIVTPKEEFPILINKVFVDSIYIPAVSENVGKLTKFFINIYKGDGKVFISLPPFFDQKSAISFLLAKEAICKLYPNCNNYSYLFYTNDVIFAEGFSGTAGFALLILSFFENKSRIVDYPITGFMLPNGVIAPVAGIDQKLNATLEKFPYLVAPTKKDHIIPAYTILDLLKIYFNESFNYTVTVPKDYEKAIKEVTEDMCKDVDNYIVFGLLSKKRYYSAASYCYREKSKGFEVNLTDDEIDSLIKNLENRIEKIKCEDYECKEIKYQIESRLNLAKNLKGKEKYWRYYTALGWMKFLNITVERKDTCKYIEEEYNILKYIYQDLPDTSNCFEMRENLAKVYASLVTYRDKESLEEILNLVKYYLNKNGFSVSAYNYMEYSEDLYKLEDYDSAFYYAILALEYAI